MMKNIRTDAFKILVDLQIRVAKNGQAKLIQIVIPLLIDGFPRSLIVLRPVQFNDELCGGAVKINDIGSNHFLAMNGNREVLQKIIPKMPLLLCHVAS